MLKIYFLSLAVLTSFALPTFAQTANKAPIQKVKLFTSIGAIKDSMVVSPEAAAKVIMLPLTIVDDKKAVYTISSYQFIYKKVGVTEDETTGKVTPTSNIVAELFKTVPVSPIWIKSIQEQVKPGEELWFTDILVKGNKDQLFYAPSLRIIVR